MGGAVVLWLVMAVSIAAAQAPPDALPRKGQLGVRVAAVPDEIRPSLKLEPTGGVLVQLLVPGGSAEVGGLQPGDILLALQGRRIESVADFLTRASALSAGQTCELGLMRSGRRTTRSLLVHERPRDRGANFDVLYHSVVSGGARLRTIVTRPHAAGRHPVLVLIPGLGATTVDQPLSDPGAYSRILAEFAKDGWVTVRVDKPGIGDSEGGPDGETGFEAELDVYRQTLRAARQYDFADAEQLFVFGHSLGGVFAPMLAAEVPVKGIAVYGTVLKPWTEYLIENRRRQELLAGTDAPTIDARVRDMAAAVQALMIDRVDPSELARTRPELRSVLKVHAAGRPPLLGPHAGLLVAAGGHEPACLLGEGQRARARDLGAQRLHRDRSGPSAHRGHRQSGPAGAGALRGPARLRSRLPEDGIGRGQLPPLDDSGGRARPADHRHPEGVDGEAPRRPLDRIVPRRPCLRAVR